MLYQAPILTKAEIQAIRNSATASNNQFFRILSIDGGGIRGVLPGVIIAGLEKMIQEITGDENARLAQYFDLIAGTSTGGILTCLYLCPDKKGEGENKKPKYSAQQAVDLYLKEGGKIFKSSWLRKSIAGNLFSAKYSVKVFEALFESYLKNTTLLDIKNNPKIANCLVTNLDLTTERPSFFTSHDVGEDRTRNRGKVPNFYLKDVARSTSAAPTYFAPAYVKPSNLPDEPKNYRLRVDGGVFANNPSLSALIEALKMKHDQKGRSVSIENISILSIGTKGKSKPEAYYDNMNNRKYKYRNMKKGGIKAWIPKLINIMINQIGETTAFQLKSVYDLFPNSKNHQNQYIYITPEIITASPEIDDASKKNLNALTADGLKAFNDNKESLKKALVYIFQGRSENLPSA